MITPNSKSILLADDSVFFRTKLSAILMEAGHRVRFASDGADVIREIQIDPNGTDLLILDLQMPNIDGFGVLEWMRKNDCKIPVLAVTGVYEPGEVIEKLRSLGARGLLTKGFTPEQVIYWVNKLLFPERRSERAEERIPVSIPVDFTIGDATTHTGFLLNISVRGLFLHTRNELPPGAVVGLKFILPGSDKVINCKGIVKWGTPTSATQTLFGGAGVEFTKINEDDLSRLEEFIKKELGKITVYEAV
jgi:uncharacterized protein (TIGR02266 family)